MLLKKTQIKTSWRIHQGGGGGIRVFLVTFDFSFYVFTLCKPSLLSRNKQGRNAIYIIFLFIIFTPIDMILFTPIDMILLLNIFIHG